MESQKRKAEETKLSEDKRQRQEKPILLGGISLPEGPPVDYKTRLAKPLRDALLLVGGGATSMKHRMNVKNVSLSQPVKKRARDYLAGLESHQMVLDPPTSRPTPIQSEEIANADMQVNVFDLISFVFRQWPNKFIQQFAILLNPLKRDTKAVTDELKQIWHTKSASGEGNRPDNLLLQTWDADGNYDPKPNSLFDFEGKQYDVFSKDFDNDAVASGKLDLFNNWDRLGVDAKHAVGQLAQYLVDDKLTTGILYTRKVLWEIQVLNADPEKLSVSISEPVTASDTNPSMAEVVFALVHEQLTSEQEKAARTTGELSAGTSATEKEPETG